MSYAVSQSTRELGLRMALGASAADLLRIVMAKGLANDSWRRYRGRAAAGVGVDAVDGGDMLYKVSPRDPGAFADGHGW